MGSVLRIKSPPYAAPATPEVAPSGGHDAKAVKRRDAAMLWHAPGDVVAQSPGAVSLLSVNGNGVLSRHVVRPTRSEETAGGLLVLEEAVGTWELGRRHDNAEVLPGSSQKVEVPFSNPQQWPVANLSYSNGSTPAPVKVQHSTASPQAEVEAMWAREVEVRTYAAERLPIWADPEVKLAASSMHDSQLACTIVVPLAGPIPWEHDGEGPRPHQGELKELLADAITAQLSPGRLENSGGLDAGIPHLDLGSPTKTKTEDPLDAAFEHTLEALGEAQPDSLPPQGGIAAPDEPPGAAEEEATISSEGREGNIKEEEVATENAEEDGAFRRVPGEHEGDQKESLEKDAAEAVEEVAAEDVKAEAEVTMKTKADEPAEVPAEVPQTKSKKKKKKK